MRNSPLEPTPPRVTLRRLVFAILVALTVALLSWESWVMLLINGLNPVKTAIFILFVVLVIPIALFFWTAAIGFLVQLRGGDVLDVSRTLDGLSSQPSELPRTAIVMPTYNEDPVRVFAGLKATCESVAETGFGPAYDFFILSDTTDPDTWVREELAFTELRGEVSRPDALFYRNRRENLERKSGNIADFCATWGERYHYMIVMDADSVMTGTSLVNLVRLMEQNPHVGIVQAPPLPVNGRTLFSRLHQFAARAYNSIFITGLNFWQGGAANYWGHNAIIRIRPFVEHCRLPKLSGKEPLGGSILSHDFVEAALMRRAGWKVYLASELDGTYEELPPSLITFAVRDQRWCQGNLQHARLLFTPGLQLVNRIHLWMGVMSYASAPLWMLALVLSTIEALREKLVKHPYFPREQTLFPTWHISIQHRAMLLFLVVMALLMLPKLFSLITNLRNREQAAVFGGRLKLSLSVFFEIICSTLIAPILAIERTRFVTGILLGRSVKWKAQQRDDMQTSLREALSRHATTTLLGLAWAGLFLFAAPRLLWWFSPVLVGLVLAIPVSVWSSRAKAGAWAKRRGLWLIPEEIATSHLLQQLQEELQNAHARRWAAPRDGLAWVLEDPSVLEAHLALLLPATAPDDPLRLHRLDGLQLKVRHQGPHALSPQEKRELLLDADSLRALRMESPSEDFYPISEKRTKIG
jgi:membrane glycosyltransferase